MHYKKNFSPIYEHRPPVNVKIDIEDLTQNLGYDCICSDDYNDIAVDENTPLLVCGAGVIPQDIVKKYTIINSHPGYVPFVRGLDALKWAIIEDKPIGVTTHIIGEEVDAGEIIERRMIPVYKNDTFHAVAQRVYEYEVAMLVESLKVWTNECEYINAGENVLHKRMPSTIESSLMKAFDGYLDKRGIEKIDFNMKQLFDNWDFDIVGISNIDYPVDNTIMFVESRDKDKIKNLENCKYCVVVTDNEVCPDKKIGVYNFFLNDDNPQKRFDELLSGMRK